jgi:hypothetical protein
MWQVDEDDSSANIFKGNDVNLLVVGIFISNVLVAEGDELWNTYQYHLFAIIHS